MAVTSVQAGNTLLIKGKIAEKESSVPIEYATVVLKGTDSTIITVTTADSLGQFTINASEKGRYILHISLISYKESEFPIEVNEPETDLGTIYIESDALMMEGATVSAKRPVIEQRIDKLVMNVADAVAAQGSNGVDMLRRAPGVTIDFDGNVKLNGSAVEVWIDNRPSHLSGKELEVLLKSTEGTSIDRIEIMAHPSAKYDAAGGGGIINIITKKSFLEGFNGSARLSYGGMAFDRYVQETEGSLSLNYRGKKTYTFASYGASYHENVADLLSTSVFGKDGSMTQDTRSRLESNYLDHTFRAGNDWNIDSKNILGFIVNGSFDKSREVSYGNDNYNTLSQNGTTLTKEWNFNNNPHRFQNIRANLNYTHTFDQSKMQELTANADYSYSDSRNNTLRESIMVDPTTLIPLPAADTILFSNSSTQILQLWSAKVDYQQIFWQTGMIEAGAKWSKSTTDNTDITEQTNSFRYDEQIAALYFSAAKSFGTKWSVKIGLRGEYTHSKGNWHSAGKENVKSYFKLFPTLFVSYVPSQKFRYSLSYTRRISRPGYYQLNPFRSYFGNSYVEGNPDLTPSYSDNMAFMFGLGNHLNIAVMYNINSNLIMQRPYIDDMGNQHLTWENFGTQQMAGGSVSLSELPIFKWLSISANYFAAYNANKGYEDFYTGSFLQSFYASLSFTLPHEWKIELGGFGNSGMNIGYLRMRPMFMFYGGIKKNLWDGRGTVSLNVDDIFRTMKTDVDSDTDGGKYILKQNFNMQRITLSFEYRFGKSQNARRRNVGNIDESSRMGGGNATGVSTGGM